MARAVAVLKAIARVMGRAMARAVTKKIATIEMAGGEIQQSTKKWDNRKSNADGNGDSKDNNVNADSSAPFN